VPGKRLAHARVAGRAAWHAEPMLGREPRQVSRAASVARRQPLAGTAPTRITAFIVAFLCTVLLLPACAGAAFEQPADHSTSVPSALASASASVAPDTHATAAAAAAGVINLRLVGEALIEAAGAVEQAAIAGVVQDAYLSAFRVHADATVLPSRAVGGVFSCAETCLWALSMGT